MACTKDTSQAVMQQQLQVHTCWTANTKRGGTQSHKKSAPFAGLLQPAAVQAEPLAVLPYSVSAGTSGSQDPVPACMPLGLLQTSLPAHACAHKHSMTEA